MLAVLKVAKVCPSDESPVAILEEAVKLMNHAFCGEKKGRVGDWLRPACWWPL